MTQIDKCGKILDVVTSAHCWRPGLPFGMFLFHMIVCRPKCTVSLCLFHASIFIVRGLCDLVPRHTACGILTHYRIHVI